MSLESIYAAGLLGQSYGTGSTTGTGDSSNMFSELLSNYMALSASSIGSFSDTSGSSSYMDGIMGLGGSSSLFGMGDSSSTLTLLLLMYLMSQQQTATPSAESSMSNASQYCQHQYVNAYASASTLGIPSQAWLEANPALTSHIGERSAQDYTAVVNQFNVENNERYRVNKNGIGDTYCNIFVWDVTRAMGAEIPHYVTAGGVPSTSAQADARELDANAVNDWLNTYGGHYGWRKVSAQEAQQYANNGMPAVTSWKNGSGHGHLQMVVPSREGGYNASSGVTIAQAGRQLKSYDHITSVYGAGTLDEVEYFVHI